MNPILLPFLERAGRQALVRGGFRSEMVETPAGRVHLYDAPGRGSLPAIVVLHGLSAAATPFAPVLARLRRAARRVVALDYPGHGFSDDPSGPLTPERLLETTRAVLDERLRGEPAVVVGNSLGGVVALDHARARPAQVRALVLLSPAGAACSEDEWRELRDAFTVTSRRSALALLARVQHRTPLLARAIAHEMPSRMRRPAIQEILAGSRAEGIDGAEVSRLEMPILLWWGKSERLLPGSHLAWWRRHLPAHAVIERPADVGHCPHLDAPAAVADRILSFARDTARH